jgi:hypothetical protein
MKEMKEVKQELVATKVSMDFINNKYEELKKENAELKERMNQLEKKIEQNQLTKDENVALLQNIQEVKMEVKEKDQYDRNRNLEINGLDWPNNENLQETVQRVADAYGVNFYKPDQVDVGHRIPNKNKNKPSAIIIQFKHRESRDAWLSSRKKIVTNDNIWRNGNGSRVYLNENMSPYFKELFWKTKNFAKEKNIKFVWFRQGKIHMRTHENDSFRIIKSEEDLHV